MSDTVSDSELLWPKESLISHPAPADTEPEGFETEIKWPAVILACGVLGVALVAGSVAVFPSAGAAVEGVYRDTMAGLGLSAGTPSATPANEATPAAALPALPEIHAAQVAPAAAPLPLPHPAPVKSVPAVPQEASTKQSTVTPVAPLPTEVKSAGAIQKPAVVQKQIPVAAPAKLAAPSVPQASPAAPPGDKSRCEELFNRGIVTSTEAGVRVMTTKGALFRGCLIHPGEKIGQGNETVESIDPKNMVVRTSRRVLTIVD